jgi:ABC-type bacteriocin/lantibiotic exporter with double-glycine peptidase domain
MAHDPVAKYRTVSEVFQYMRTVLGPEKRFYVLTILYGVGISLLSLATPISVQMLINTVANIGLTTPLVVLSLTLFVLLLMAGGLNALRIHLMDLFGRHFYSRMVSEIALRALYAMNPFFDDRRQSALFNRYFDTIVVIKQIPNLLVGGFTILLQSAVGFVLVSSYHPLLLAFNVAVGLLIWLVWIIWGKRAIRSSVELSHRKHATAAWLEGLGRANGFFKSERHIDEALRHTDEVTREYIEQHERHFSHHFAQTLSFLFIYAAASAILLGLGGWLVIQGELSLGQLVAAELVLSVVFVGVSQMGIYLSYFYDVCAAVDELSLFYDIEQELPDEAPRRLTCDASLSFRHARGELGGVDIDLDFSIDSGERVCAYSDSHAVQRFFMNLLSQQQELESGLITLGDADLRGLRSYDLRQEIILLERASVVDGKLRDYLRLSANDDESVDMLGCLRAVGLERTIAQLEHGLDTWLAATGWPLAVTETLQLKLAAAMIAQPRVLVMSQIYDAVPETYLRAAITYLQEQCGSTIIYFSNKRADLDFTSFLFLGQDRQALFESYDHLCSDGGVDYRPAQPVLTPCAPKQTGESS